VVRKVRGVRAAAEPPPGSGDELVSLLTAQAQGVGQPADRVRMRPFRAAALDVAERPDAQLRPFRELLLRQPGQPAESSQSGSELPGAISHLVPFAIHFPNYPAARRRPQSDAPDDEQRESLFLSASFC
jgi:hypothetical protein